MSVLLSIFKWWVKLLNISNICISLSISYLWTNNAKVQVIDFEVLYGDNWRLVLQAKLSMLTVTDEEGLQHVNQEMEAKIVAPFAPERFVCFVFIFWGVGRKKVFLCFSFFPICWIMSLVSHFMTYGFILFLIRDRVFRNCWSCKRIYCLDNCVILKF